MKVARLPAAVLTGVLLVACGERGSTADESLREELLRLGREDQAAREGFAGAAASGDEAYGKRLMARDAVRTARLKEIVGTSGWPTVATVGRDGVGAAWLVLQHSPDAAWQASMLATIERAGEAGELDWMAVANLTDRVLVQSAKPQRYGQSFSLVEGRMVAHPIEDVERLEERRAARGLPPMAEYVQLLSETIGVPVQWP